MNKLEVLSNALEIISENQRSLMKVLIERDSGEVRRMVDSYLTENQKLITTIVNDFRELKLDYVAPYCDEYFDEDKDKDAFSKVSMQLTERG